jgi:hypothetical protein
MIPAAIHFMRKVALYFFTRAFNWRLVGWGHGYSDEKKRKVLSVVGNFKLMRDIENGGGGVGDMYRECRKFCDPNDL